MTPRGNILQGLEDRILPSLVVLRHELHQHPEIRFEEQWTSDRIAAYLRENDIPFTRGHARGTGIVATIQGNRPGRVIALRADMDGLEIDEKGAPPYHSQLPGRMHACGHDGHMAILCGVATLLNEAASQFQGTVKCIFQPGEELAAAGRLIVEEGLLEEVEAAFALHAWPGQPVGTVTVGSGYCMAGARFFNIEVKGKGGHGANPGDAVDPILVAAHVITALQNIVSRECQPWESAVVTVGQMHAGSAANIIPDTAILTGTFRALEPERLTAIAHAIERIAVNTAKAYGAESVLRFDEASYPPLYNDPEMVDFAKKSIISALDEYAVQELERPVMASEDFAYYLQKVPGAFLFLGNDHPDQSNAPALHNACFDFNDEAIAIGVKIMTALALDFLAQ